MTATDVWRIRRATATATDRAFLEALAPRLTIGAAPWLDPAVMLRTMRAFLLGDLEKTGAEAAMFLAEAEDGTPVGAVAIEQSKHFTGEPQDYIGELAVMEAAEGRGAGAALLAAAEEWARRHGATRIALDTGAANTHARAFYARHGYAAESVKLVKVL